jgi:hypothetical protein
MIRIFLLLLISANVGAAVSTVDIDTAAKIYQAAGVREQIRPSLVTMPARMRDMFAAGGGAKLTQAQLAAVDAAAARGFRIDVFEPPALNAFAANLDPATVKRTLEFLEGDVGRRMVAADVAVARLDEQSIDKVMNGALAAPSTPRRDALMTELEHAAKSTESTVEIFLSMGRALAIGTAIGSGTDPIAADERAQKSGDATRRDMEVNLREPLRRLMAYGYRDLSDADLKRLLAFLKSKAGTRYVGAYIASQGAGFDAMGRRCGEQIGESWRELALQQAGLPDVGADVSGAASPDAQGTPPQPPLPSVVPAPH